MTMYLLFLFMVFPAGDKEKNWLRNYFANSLSVGGEFEIKTEYDPKYVAEQQKALDKKNEGTKRKSIMAPAKQFMDCIWAHDKGREIFHCQGNTNVYLGFYLTPDFFMRQINAKNYIVEDNQGRPNHGNPGDYFIYFNKYIMELIEQCEWNVSVTNTKSIYESSEYNRNKIILSFEQGELNEIECFHKRPDMETWYISSHIYIRSYFRVGSSKYPNNAVMDVFTKERKIYTKTIKAKSIQFNISFDEYMSKINLPKDVFVASTPLNRVTNTKSPTPLKDVIQGKFVFKDEMKSTEQQSVSLEPSTGILWLIAAGVLVVVCLGTGIYLTRKQLISC